MLFKKGIYSYYDSNVNVEHFQLASSKTRKKILSGFLDVNKKSFDKKYLYNAEDLKQLKKIIFPFMNEEQNDRNKRIDFYVDFQQKTFSNEFVFVELLFRTQKFSAENHFGELIS